MRGCRGSGGRSEHGKSTGSESFAVSPSSLLPLTCSAALMAIFARGFMSTYCKRLTGIILSLRKLAVLVVCACPGHLSFQLLVPFGFFPFHFHQGAPFLFSTSRFM